MRTFLTIMFASSLSWSCIEVCGAPIPASFALDPSQSVLNVEVVARSGFITLRDSDRTSMSGTVEALVDLGVGPALPPTAGLNLTGGRINSDSPLDLSLFFFLVLDVDAHIEGLSATFRTRVPLGTMTLANPAAGRYAFNASQYELLLDRGTATATGQAVGTTINESFNFAQEPVAGSPETGTTGSLTLAEAGGDAWVKTYQGLLRMAVNVSVPLPIEGFNGTVTANVSGAVVGSGTVLQAIGMPGDYDRDNDVDGADFLLWQESFAAGVERGRGADGDFSGNVELGDLDVLLTNLGPPSSTNVSAPIPEPATWQLLLAGLGLGYLRKARP